VNVLAVIHGSTARSGVFEEELTARGHRLEEWSLAWEEPPPRSIDDYDAVLVLGGAMHADQDDHHPWLRDENLFIQRLLDRHVPLLGVCLGAQLIARAAHAAVYPASQPEIGWVGVERTEAAGDDPLLRTFPARFPAFQWHYYTYELPGGAVELATSSVCTQAFRLGECTWGIQFHAEVTADQVRTWIDEAPDELPGTPAELVAETAEKIGDWNALGRSLAGAFVEAAERATSAAV
jgi:GMP synthase (glutamine-hydrolysing)